VIACVVTALKAALPASKTIDAERTDNTEAYNQFLLGRNFENQLTEAGYRHAVEAYKRAVALDPNYAAAYAGLALAESGLGDSVGDPGGLTRATAASERAIALAPQASTGYISRGVLRTEYLWDWDGARKDFDQALSLDPNGDVEGELAGLAIAEGRLTAAITKWSPAPPSLPISAKISLLAGDPAQPGPFTLRLELPAKTTIGPHTHSKLESVTILAGEIYHETGEKLDKSKGSLLTTGGFISLPAEMAHSLWTVKTTIIQVTGTGPFDLHYINPADDPRNDKNDPRNKQ
jgi:tetratricopeptide (TPR) repeat protein